MKDIPKINFQNCCHAHAQFHCNYNCIAQEKVPIYIVVYDSCKSYSRNIPLDLLCCLDIQGTDKKGKDFLGITNNDMQLIRHHNRLSDSHSTLHLYCNYKSINSNAICHCRQHIYIYGEKTIRFSRICKCLQALIASLNIYIEIYQLNVGYHNMECPFKVIMHIAFLIAVQDFLATFLFNIFNNIIQIVTQVKNTDCA